MVPLTTLQGLPAEQLRTLIDGRPIYLWGFGDVAQDVLVSLGRSELSASGILHSAPEVGAHAYGLPVLPASQVLSSPNRPFVVIASLQFRQQAEIACQNAGLRAGQDYLTHLSISRPVAVIEVASGTRSYGCLTPATRPQTSMSASTFKAVLSKVLADQPQLCHVELSWLGDPLSNPEIADIVRHCESRVPCTVSTPLLETEHLEALISARPSRLNIIVQGYGERYSELMDGACWDVFRNNLERLKASLVRATGTPRTTIRYLESRNDAPTLRTDWKELLQGSCIALSIESPYVTPYDPLLAHCNGEEISLGATQAIERLNWRIDPALAACTVDREQPCLSQRIFPVIGTDRTVGLCHLYQKPLLAEDYLAIPWSELLARRHRAAHCVQCQQHGLHRLDLPVLTRRFPQLASQLFE